MKAPYLLLFAVVALAVGLASAPGCSETYPRSAPKNVAAGAGEVSLSTPIPFTKRTEGYVAIHHDFFVRVSPALSVTVTAKRRIHSLELNPARISRSGSAMESRGTEASLTHDGSLFRSRGDVEDRVRVDGNGAEETWTFPALPAGGGDLVVSQKVSAHGAVVTRDHSVLFEDEGLAIGEGKWIDARGSVTNVPVTFQNGVVEFRIADEIVRTSAYPAVLDPVVSAESEVDPASTAGLATQSRDGSYRPAVGFDGTNYLVAWRDIRGLNPTVMGARVSESGVVLDPDGIIIARLDPGTYFGDFASQIGVTATPGGFLVTWSGVGFVYSRPYYAKRVRADGTVVDEDPFAIPETLGIFGSGNTPAGTFSLIASPATLGKYDGVVYFIPGIGNASGASSYVATQFDAQSQNTSVLLARDLLISASSTSSDAGSTRTITTRKLGPTGVVGAAQPIALFAGNVELVGGGFDGTNYVIVGYNQETNVVEIARIASDGYTPIASPIDTGIRSRPLFTHADADGVLIGAYGTTPVICRFTTSGIPIAPCSAYAYDSSRAQNVVFGKTSYGQFANRVIGSRGNQPEIQLFHRMTDAPLGNVITVTKSANAQKLPSVAYDKTSGTYFGVWIDDATADEAPTDSEGGFTLMGATLRPRGVTFDVGAPVRISSPGSRSIGRPKVVAGDGGFMVLWTDERADSNGRVLAQKIALAGGVPTLVVEPHVLAAWNSLFRDASLAADSTGWVFSWIGQKVMAKRVPFSATPAEVDAAPTRSLSGDTPRTPGAIASVFDGRQTIVAWSEAADFTDRIQALSFPDGQNFSSTTAYPAVTAYGLKSSLSFASDGASGSLLVWGSIQATGQSDVFGKVFGRDKVRPDDTESVVRIATDPDRDESIPAVAYSNDGESYLVAWASRTLGNNSDLLGNWVTPTGRLLSEAPGHVLSATTASAVAGDAGPNAPASESEGTPSLATGPESTVGVLYARFDLRSGYRTTRTRFRTVVSGSVRGASCSQATDCASRFCVSGVCCDAACNDGCGVCGGSAAEHAPPNAVRGVCAPFVADAVCTTSPRYKCSGASVSCPNRCTGDGSLECVPGSVCAAGECGTKGSVCVDDVTAYAADGNVSCGAYTCTEGICRSACNEIEHCAPGNICDFEHHCVPAPPPPTGSDACAVSATRSPEAPPGFATVAIAAIALACARRSTRRRRRRQGRGSARFDSR